MKKLLASILLIAMLLALVACTGGDEKKPTDKKDETTAQVTEHSDTSAARERVENSLPELDYGGEKVTILTNGLDKETQEKVNKKNGVEVDENLVITSEIFAEELNGEPVNDAIYNRSLAVGEQLNVEVVEAHTTETADVNALVRRDVASGNGEYDIVCNSVFYGCPLVFEGNYYNLRDNGIEDYIDISKPWWSQKWLEEAICGDRLYQITGSLSLSLTRDIFVVYYNKSLAESHNLEDMYQVVRNGNWTLDYISEVSESLYVDLNGNSTKDKEDQYGCLTNHYECVDIYWSCFDLQFFAKNSDGWYEFSVNADKLASTLEQVYAFTYENNGVFDSGSSEGFAVMANMFAQGQSLFSIQHLSNAETKLFRNMQNEYGILPEPKYDSAQKEYYSYAHDQYTVFYIPISVKDPLRSAAVLEAMACESYNSVEVAYLDTALKGRYSNDIDTRQMLDIILNGFRVDASWIYGGDMGISIPPAKLLRGIVYSGTNEGQSSELAKLNRTIPVWARSIQERLEALDY